MTNTKQVLIIIPQEQKTRWHKAALDQDISLKELIQNAVEQYLANLI
jgi:hypothetical protein